MVPLYKGKGDRLVYGNSRGISLLSVIGKLYGKVLITRIRGKTEGVLGEEQCGFRKERGCVDQIPFHSKKRYVKKRQQKSRLYFGRLWT